MNNDGPNVAAKLPTKFDRVEWDDTNNYSTPGTYGFLSQSMNPYDGIGCREVKRAYRLDSANSNVTIEIPELMQSYISEATIEFWFKRTTTQ